MKSLKRAISFCLTLTMVFALIACSDKQQQQPGTSSGGSPNASSSAPQKDADVTLSMGHKMGAESLDGQAFQMFADLAAEKSGGTVKINVFPSSQLGDGPTQVNNVLLGSQDIYAESISEWAGVTPLADVGSSVPYLFNSPEDYFDLVAGDFGREQEAAFEAGGVHLINTARNWLRGPYRVLCSVKPIQSIDDLKGLRLRTWENATYMTCWTELGTNPLVIGWTDTYLALSQGTVEAVTSPASQVEDMSFYEVAPYITNINEFPQEVGVMMNLAAWNKLSDAQKTAVTEAANEAGAWAAEAVYDYVEESNARMAAAGATFYEMDTAPCTEALKGVYLKLEADGALPEGLLEALGLK